MITLAVIDLILVPRNLNYVFITDQRRLLKIEMDVENIIFPPNIKEYEKSY